MSTIVDTLQTRFVLDGSGYQAGAQKILSATSSITNRITGLAKTALSLPSLLAGSALAGFGVVASKSAADIDALKMGLTAVAGSASAAEEQFKRLKEVAKLPGLSLKGAIEGSIALQSAGLSANLAERAIQGFGNALATVGKGKDDLEGVILALSQIQSKGKISAEEINQLSERVPQIRKLMEGAFGTSDSEALQKMGIKSEAFIAKIVDQLEKLPKVAGSSKNTWENFGDSLNGVMVAIGRGINSVLIPALDKVGAFLDYAANSGIVDKITQGFRNLFGGDLGDVLVRGLSFVLATLKNLPNMVQSVTGFISQALQVLARNAAVFASVMGGIFIGGAIVQGVETLVTAFIALRKAIQAAGLASVIMEAIVTGGASAIKSLAAAGAGVEVATAIYGTLDNLFEGMKVKFGAMPGLADILKDQQTFMKGFENSQAGGPGSAPGSKTPVVETDTSRIRKATERTAVAVEKQLQLNEQMFGIGGARSDQALSAVNVGRITRPGMTGNHNLDRGFHFIGEAFNDLMALADVANRRPSGGR